MPLIRKAVTNSTVSTIAPAFGAATDKRAYRPSLVTRRSRRQSRRENRAL